MGGENLGEMGPPIKVTAAGKTFFLCCKSCQKEVDADPKAVVAKLKNRGVGVIAIPQRTVMLLFRPLRPKQ